MGIFKGLYCEHRAVSRKKLRFLLGGGSVAEVCKNNGGRRSCSFHQLSSVWDEKTTNVLTMVFAEWVVVKYVSSLFTFVYYFYFCNHLQRGAVPSGIYAGTEVYGNQKCKMEAYKKSEEVDLVMNNMGGRKQCKSHPE